jgi:hydrogenase maturation factor HypE
MLIMGLILQTTGGGGGSNSTGYVGGGTQYMITNTLEIYASAAIQTLLKLNLIRSERRLRHNGDSMQPKRGETLFH